MWIKQKVYKKINKIYMNTLHIKIYNVSYIKYTIYHIIYYIFFIVNSIYIL